MNISTFGKPQHNRYKLALLSIIPKNHASSTPGQSVATDVWSALVAKKVK